MSVRACQIHKHYNWQIMKNLRKHQQYIHYSLKYMKVFMPTYYKIRMTLYFHLIYLWLQCELWSWYISYNVIMTSWRFIVWDKTSPNPCFYYP